MRRVPKPCRRRADHSGRRRGFGRAIRQLRYARNAASATRLAWARSTGTSSVPPTLSTPHRRRACRCSVPVWALTWPPKAFTPEALAAPEASEAWTDPTLPARLGPRPHALDGSRTLRELFSGSLHRHLQLLLDRAVCIPVGMSRGAGGRGRADCERRSGGWGAVHRNCGEVLTTGRCRIGDRRPARVGGVDRLVRVRSWSGGVESSPRMRDAACCKTPARRRPLPAPNWSVTS